MASTQHGKQFTLFTFTGFPPNGWKVAIVLEELGLPYHLHYLDLEGGEHKGAEYTKLNPNGRIPTLIDHHNGDFTIWESDAIIMYLVDKYDADRKVSFEGFEEKSVQLQWLFFQASGQAPYYGQAAWFLTNAEKIPTAIDRYLNEGLRVVGVLESVLSKKTWLVGDKCSVADLSFVPFNGMAFNNLLKGRKGFNLEKDYPSVYRWHNAMMDRPAVQRVYAIRKETLGRTTADRLIQSVTVEG